MEAERHLAQRLHVDVPLILGLVALAVIGLTVLYSASGRDGELVLRQGIRLGIAFTVMVALAQVPPRRYFYWSPWLYGGCLLLLLAVLAAGYVGKGAQRWLALGSFQFQPSEIAKIAVPMMIAFYLCDHALPPRLRHVAVCVVFIVLPVLLIARQPDLGTALLVACSGGFVLFFAGMRWRLIVVAGLLAAAAAPVAWTFLHDYQRRRVWTFLNPEVDPLGAGYHIIQSKIAIGSGGFYGKGWMNGTQSQLEFIPERSTDFIFAVLGEEFGLMGVLGLLVVYAFVVGRGLYLAVQAQELFGRLLAGSLVLTFFVYAFVNVGMVSGLLPVVGLPLPLVSYGGTSLVTVMAAFGILMSVHSHRRLLSS